MNYSLVPIDAGGGPSISLVRPVLLVGRHPECDVRINLPKISRRHCCVVLAYDRVIIRDLGSRNGLRVNGRVVEESRLYPRDEVAIGPLLYRLVSQADVSAPDRKSPSSASPPPVRNAGLTESSSGRPASMQSGHDDSDEIGLVPLDSF